MRRLIVLIVALTAAMFALPAAAAPPPSGLIYAADLYVGGYGAVTVDPGGAGLAATCGGDPTQSASPRLFVLIGSPGLVWSGTDCIAAPLYTPEPGSTAGFARWSPDGRRVAFNVLWTGLDSEGNPVTRYGIRVGDVVVDPTTSARTLANVRLAVDLGGGGTVPFNWSPDNRRIVMSVGSPGAIQVADLDDDDLAATLLTTSPDGDFYGAFSPDGSRVVFSRALNTSAGRRADLFTIPAGGGAVTRITSKANTTTMLNVQAGWSPDGAYLTFAGRKNGGDIWSHVYRIDERGATKAVDLTPRAKAWFGVQGWRPS